MQGWRARLAKHRQHVTPGFLRRRNFSSPDCCSGEPIRNPASRGDARGGIHAASGYPQAACDTCGKDRRHKDRRDPECRSCRSWSFPILNCEGHSPASGTAPVKRPSSGRAESPNDAHCSLGKRASSAKPFFPAEINICTLLTNCVLSFTSVSALRYSHTKLRIASWTWR